MEPFTEKEITLQDAIDHGLTEEEFERIKGFLGRVPTVTELGVYSGMWSEHCSYKNSILQLKTLPSEGPRNLATAGEENAGAIDIGGGLAVVFKIESHNHPTAIEPFQGAATGVGGIMRDIFTMGARPICSLNSLRFGPPSEMRNRYLFTKAVEGIAFYGNCLGVAVAGGEVFFDPTYSRNCLVNAMAVGVARIDRMATATAKGEGNPVFYVGATTGRDGIHGASFASRDLSEESESKRSAVQVGDPFKEKLLLEATLELIRSGALVGIQDMGAAGLSCSTSEMSAKGRVGMDIDLNCVPLREAGMNAYEIMLSESQERMLVVGKKGQEETIRRIFEKWDLHAEIIGTVTASGRLRIFHNDRLCADIPADSLVLGGGAPRYVREQRRPEHIDRLARFSDDELERSDDLAADLLQLLGSVNVGSKRSVYEQYDTEVGLVRVQGPGGQAGVIRIPHILLEDIELTNFPDDPSRVAASPVPETHRGLAVSTDCNSRYVYLDPERGAALAVYESARNVAVTGAEPLGITNCLNFANPYVPENYYMFAQSVRGMGDACRRLGIPVTGGNVSFYNESEEGPILPTPAIGMVGLLENVDQAIGPFFKQAGERLFLIGDFLPTFGGSEYLWLKKAVIAGIPPEVRPDTEKALHGFLQECSKRGLLQSAADLSLGGLAAALFRMSYNMETSMGFQLLEPVMKEFEKKIGRADKLFFGETSATIVVSVLPENVPSVKEVLAQRSLTAVEIGVSGCPWLDFGLFRVEKEAAIHAFEGALRSVFAQG
jgi:phosphoribosylformylglycinamidine synthase